MKITLKQLAVFSAIYKTGSVTQAAYQLALSQSAVSMALQELEKLLNAPLFERNGKKLIANQASVLLYPKAVAVLEQVQEIEQQFHAQQVRLEIGASSTIGNYLLPALVSAFMQRYPHIEIVLHVYNTKEVCENLLSFEYDLGFIEGENRYTELVARAWSEDELTLFCATHSQFIADNIQTVTLADLALVPLVVREAGSGTRETQNQLILNQLATPKVIQLSHSEAIKQAVIHDFGVGCLSKYVIADPLALGKIRTLRLAHSNLNRTLWLVHHRNKTFSEALNLFVDFCQQAV